MQNLFEPLAINELTIAFLQERARGGVGLIILGGSTGTARCFAESPFKGVLRLDHDDVVADLRRMTDAVHVHGTPIFAELMAGFGPMAAPTPQYPLIAASPQSIVTPEDQFPRGIHVPGGRATPTPREATVEEIQALRRELVACAVRCRRAGFDGVEPPASTTSR
jgi:2,4-dienoyl-CoA reductase (NADPH2)